MTDVRVESLFIGCSETGRKTAFLQKAGRSLIRCSSIPNTYTISVKKFPNSSPFHQGSFFYERLQIMNKRASGKLENIVKTVIAGGLIVKSLKNDAEKYCLIAENEKLKKEIDGLKEENINLKDYERLIEPIYKKIFRWVSKIVYWLIIFIIIMLLIEEK